MALAVVLAVASAIWLLILFQLSDPRIFQIIRLKNADISILDSVNGIVDRYKQNGYSVVKFNSNIISRDEVISILGVSNEELQ